jgi:hypothetical protein
MSDRRVNVSQLLGFAAVAEGAVVDFRDPLLSAGAGAKVGGVEPGKARQRVRLPDLLGFSAVADGDAVDFRDPSFAAASGAKVGLVENKR